MESATSSNTPIITEPLINENVNSLDTFKKAYESAMNATDLRTRDYPLVWNDPTYMVSLVIGYITFVLVGKRVMKFLPAVEVPVSILFIYNFGLVLLSVYMFEELLRGVYLSKYNLLCAELTHTKSEMIIVNALWWYYFSKAIEFLDTFWMIIRKKFTQITFLHVFHHSTMLIIWWFVISWVPAGQAFFGAALNSLVHVVMYLYYALSVIPSLKDKLWWKKYITKFQLLQFVITLSHTLAGFFLTHAGSCKFPLWPQYLLASYMIMMLVLFTNFYRQEYIKRANDRKRRMEKEAIGKKMAKVDSNNNELDDKLTNGAVESKKEN